MAVHLISYAGFVASCLPEYVFYTFDSFNPTHATEMKHVFIKEICWMFYIVLNFISQILLAIALNSIIAQVIQTN